MADPAEELSNAEYLVLVVLGATPVVRLYTPAVIAENIPADRSTVNEVLSEFRERGIVEKEKRGKYRLTHRGRDFLAGDLDASELEDGDDAKN